MNNTILGRRIGYSLLAAVLISLSTWAMADPPFRIARLGYFSGTVSFSPAGTDDWVYTSVNRPLVTGDRLWADADARAELRAGSGVVRLGASTSVTLLNIDDRVTQLQLAQGSLSFNVWRLAPGEVFEVDTPNLAFTVMAPGTYRLDVGADGNATNVVVRRGLGEVSGEGVAYTVDPQVSYVFAGSGLAQYQSMTPPPPDEFEMWASERDRRRAASISARYVSPEMVGYEDLDDNGTWRTDPAYGNVWIPQNVPAGWSPYHDGHWAWIDPYGWTWVDDAPWGFAVSHYGRWAHMGNRWGWVPGPVAVAPVYAPALVAFVGGSGFALSLSLGGGGVAWFPLGPRDVYRPAYPVSQNYFVGINRSNTVVNTTTITNIYNTKNVTNITYVNQTVPGAVVAVPAATFAGAKPVAAAAVAVSAVALAKAQVMPVAAVAPTAGSVSGAGAHGSKPPAGALARPAVAQTAPPPPPVSFVAKQAALAANPGKPLEARQQAALRPAQAAAPAIQVIKAAPPPQAAPAPRPQALSPAAQAKGFAEPNAPRTAEPPRAPPAAAPRPPEARQAEPAMAPKPPQSMPARVPNPYQPAPATVPTPQPQPRPAPPPWEERRPEVKPFAPPVNAVRPPEAPRPVSPSPMEKREPAAEPAQKIAPPPRQFVPPPQPVTSPPRQFVPPPQPAAPPPRQFVPPPQPVAPPPRQFVPPPQPAAPPPRQFVPPPKPVAPPPNPKVESAKPVPKPVEKKEEEKKE